MRPSETILPFRVGARTLFAPRRRLIRNLISLEDALAGRVPPLVPLSEHEDGHFITGLPAALAPQLACRAETLKPFVRQAYARHFARLDLDFETYFAAFSAKSRSTLRRKSRRLAQASGGALDIRLYRTEAEIRLFHRHARAVSALSYQERRLDAGLPDGDAPLEAMCTLARRDRVRAWLLFVGDRPAAYLYAPAEGDTLAFAFLGYDPDFASLSPGTVLQLEAMRQLMAEKRFRLFDFTEGDGQHKRQFATGRIDCVDLLLVRPTLANRTLLSALGGFDRAVAVTKRNLRALGGERLIARLRR